MRMQIASRRINTISAHLAAAEPATRRIGIVGFGRLGQYICKALLKLPRFELAFVWDQNPAVFDTPAGNFLPAGVPLTDLDQFPSRQPDLIVEVAHPDVSREWAAKFLQHADYLMGSPTAMADEAVNDLVRAAAASSGNGVYIPSGALWGGPDIGKMADGGKLSAVTVRMKFNPDSLKLKGELGEMNANYKPGSGELVLYQGPLRPLCPLAPNNVNSMASAAIAGHTVGFDKLEAVLVADDSLSAHIVEVEAFGNVRPDGSQLSVKTQRVNPAVPGAVTGTATLDTFVQSVITAGGSPRGGGIHLC